MKEIMPIPAKLYIGPRESINGEMVTMVIGFLPGELTDKDKILAAKLMFVETKE